MNLIIIFAIIAGVIGIAIGYAAGQIVNSLTALSKRVKRLEEIEAKKPSRLPYDKKAGIEDASAIVLDLLLKQDTDMKHIEQTRERTKQLLEVLQLLRSDKKYDEDRPAGPRPEGWMD